VSKFTRGGYDWTDRYPVIAGAEAKLRFRKPNPSIQTNRERMTMKIATLDRMVGSRDCRPGHLCGLRRPSSRRISSAASAPDINRPTSVSGTDAISLVLSSCPSAKGAPAAAMP
jgi:hypothetical protein